jgi:asparagine synthase (glutamine-hydrolysing)
MCGLAGTYRRHESASRGLLLAMAGELRHRGPDGTGLYLDGDFGMANTRLAIVDLAHGDQPLSDDSGRYWAMQNGEIYNHVELRARLEALGHRFATRCDTEVIAHAYAEWGPDCLDELNGDFALAVWDRLARRLFLARDRFGVRPLFLAQPGGDLCFASEIKALLRHPACPRELDPSGLVDVFTLWSSLPDRTAFAGVSELPAAHYALVDADGRLQVRRWWDLDFTDRTYATRAEESDLVGELGALLDDATRIRLRADVPVATYLSGGLDSTYITALAHGHVPRGLQAFGIGFADARFDETSFQLQAAADLGVDLTRTRVDAAEIALLTPRVVELSERPMLRAAPAPLLRLSGSVRDAGLKVVLTGEGADELFGGYDVFREDKVRRFWARAPQSRVRPRLLGRLNAFLGQDLQRPAAFLERFYAQGLDDTGDILYSHRLRFSNTARCLRLLRPDVVVAARDPLAALVSRLPLGFGDFGAQGRAQYLEISTFLHGYLLHTQGDRMLMGNSVEGRFPFLDHRVAELAARLPESLRVRGLTEKYALRRAAARQVPAAVLARTKVPYRAPVVDAFAGPDAPDYVRELLSPAALRDAGIFDGVGVDRVLAKLRRPGVGASETETMALMGVVSTMLLHERLVARPAPAPPAVPDRVVQHDAPALEAVG